MALLTTCGDQEQFCIIKTSATSNHWAHIRNIHCGIDADDKVITIREKNDDVVVVTEQNVQALNGTSFAQCVTDVNAYFTAFPQP